MAGVLDYSTGTFPTGQGTSKRPARWGSLFKPTWGANKFWSNPMKFENIPVQLNEIVGASKSVMEIMGGEFMASVPDSSGDCLLFFITTVPYLETLDDTLNPLQMKASTDAVLFGSIMGGADDLSPRKFDYYPPGKVIDVIVPTLYLYCWRGKTNLISQANNHGAVTAGQCVVSIDLLYKMINMSVEKQFALWRQQTQADVLPGFQLGP